MIPSGHSKDIHARFDILNRNTTRRQSRHDQRDIPWGSTSRRTLKRLSISLLNRRGLGTIPAGTLPFAS